MDHLCLVDHNVTPPRTVKMFAQHPPSTVKIFDSLTKVLVSVSLVLVSVFLRSWSQLTAIIRTTV